MLNVSGLWHKIFGEGKLKGILIVIHFLTRCDVYSLDPTRLLLTLGASSGAQDKFHGNTALHWAIQAKNHVAVYILVMSGADLHIPNNQVNEV